MEASKVFIKNDKSFTCINCGRMVNPLKYTSRDHCPHCLFSLHVDINPGDRANDCKGIMVPVNIEHNSQKGYIIIYRCSKCHQLHKNKAANDDNFEMILRI